MAFNMAFDMALHSGQAASHYFPAPSATDRSTNDRALTSRHDGAEWMHPYISAEP